MQFQHVIWYNGCFSCLCVATVPCETDYKYCCLHRSLQKLNIPEEEVFRQLVVTVDCSCLQGCSDLEGYLCMMQSLLCTRSKQFSPRNKKDLGIAYYTPPLKKVKEQGEMSLPKLGPIPLNLGMDGTEACFFACYILLSLVVS